MKEKYLGESEKASVWALKRASMSGGAQSGLGHPSAGPELWLRPSPDTTSQSGRERQILSRNSRQSLLYLCKPELSGLQGQSTETSLLPGNWRQGRE